MYGSIDGDLAPSRLQRCSRTDLASADVVIVGAGIGGASLAYALASAASGRPCLRRRWGWVRPEIPMSIARAISGMRIE